VHILFVLDTWGLIGGTERYAAVVVPALLERGHRVTVLCRESRASDLDEVEVIELPGLEGERMPRWLSAELVRRVRGATPDVIYLSALHNLDAHERLVELAPLVRYVHDHTLFCPGLNKYREDGENCREAMGVECLRRYWTTEGCVCLKREPHASFLLTPIRALRRKWRELEIVQRSTRVLTNSHYMRSELLKVGFPPDTTSVLPLFTLSNTDAQPRGELDLATREFLDASDAPLLFTPARLTLPDKGVDFLTSALAAVKSPFRAVVAGTGPAEEWLRAKAVEDGVGERMHFAGWAEPGAIETLYARAEVVVCPSVWDEPFGLVGIESMAHGKPVVAFEVGGIPDWLEDGETGLLVRRKDTEAMAAAIDRLLGDPELRTRLGERGRTRVAERFPREAHVEGLEAILRAAAR